MRIELEDILDAPCRDAAHLGDLLIRFRFAQPREPSPYHRFLLQNGRDPRTILPDAPNRAAIAHNLDQIRTALGTAFEAQRSRPLLMRAGVASPADYLRFCADHFCIPLWLYTNGQALASLVDRGGVFEAIVHPSVHDYLGFGGDYGPWPVLENFPGAGFASLAAAEAWIGQRLAHPRIERLPVVRDGERRVAFLQRVGERRGPKGPVSTYLLHFGGVVERCRVFEYGSHQFLTKLDLGGFRAATCATCSHFAFSGMSHDMSGATRGYCGLRSQDVYAQKPEHALVSVFDSCAQHELADATGEVAP
jgi:hypothetical protein